MPALGLDWDDRFAVHDEIAGADYEWGQFNYVRLDPHRRAGARRSTVHQATHRPPAGTDRAACRAADAEPPQPGRTSRSTTDPPP